LRVAAKAGGAQRVLDRGRHENASGNKGFRVIGGQVELAGLKLKLIERPVHKPAPLHSNIRNHDEAPRQPSATPQDPEAFEIAEMAMDGRGRAPEFLSYLPNGRRVALRGQEVDQERMDSASQVDGEPAQRLPTVIVMTIPSSLIPYRDLSFQVDRPAWGCHEQRAVELAPRKLHEGCPQARRLAAVEVRSAS
jgi:hypothetical protein